MGFFDSLMSGTLFGGKGKAAKSEEEHLMDDVPKEGKESAKPSQTATPVEKTEISHPVLKGIMAQLNEKDDEAPMGGCKGRYMGKKA